MRELIESLGDSAIPIKYINDSSIADSVAVDVANNGYRILKTPKYASKIAKTMIGTRTNKTCDVTWIDDEGKQVLNVSLCILPDDDIPMLGEVVNYKLRLVDSKFYYFR